MRPLSPTTALATGLALTALTLPATAHGADRTPPDITVTGDTSSRCEGGVTRFRVRVVDDLRTRTAVRLDGEIVKRSTDERFSVRLRLGAAAHRLRVTSRDTRDNRFTYTLRLSRCT